jgi:putative tryptophan/tyrosine transport system substrate-binding protein
MLRLSALLVLFFALSFGAEVHGQPKTPRIGLLSVGTDPAGPLPPQWITFFEALRQLGYVEGQSISVDRRFAGGRSEVVPGFAAELVRSKVDLIVVTGMREVLAAHRATTTIPIVTVVAPDLVATGLIASLARPGGNITGLTYSTAGIGEKYVELLHQAVPNATRMAVLASRAPDQTVQTNLRDAARALNVELLPIALVKGPEEFETFFSQARRDGVSGLIVTNDGVTNLHRRQVVALAAKYRLPAIYTAREFVADGGLLAYGPSVVDLYRRAPTIVDKILKGARPAEIPVEQPLKFDLLVNLKTARSLKLALPQSLLVRAEEVIQ